jgi:hypothetical protein
MRYHARASATVNTTLAPPFETGQQASRAATIEGPTLWGASLVHRQNQLILSAARNGAPQRGPLGVGPGLMRQEDLETGSEGAQWDPEVRYVSCHRAPTCISCRPDMIWTPPSRRDVAGAAPPVLFRARRAWRIGRAGKALSNSLTALGSNGSSLVARVPHTYTHFDIRCFRPVLPSNRYRYSNQYDQISAVKNGTAMRVRSGTPGAHHYRQGGPAGGAGRARLASEKVTRVTAKRMDAMPTAVWIAGRHRGGCRHIIQLAAHLCTLCLLLAARSQAPRGDKR